MALQSFISRFATNKFGPEVARARVQNTFGKLDGRRYIRSPISSRFEIAWQDEHGWKKQTQTRAVNMSSTGASMMSPEPIAVGSAVYLNSKELQLMGSATVRHCTEQKSKFLIGLEFRGSLVRTF
ncbi:MAG TPA: PilZ domain-containing protein [Bryobacteraceae bacterium]|nr:PilZ domain-containing protein [Bryobacteraceae bacterium]HXJ44855.1 PilZ domain-containing protein [Bryobacteraceae bacterium]